jgi:hypothetical protein
MNCGGDWRKTRIRAMRCDDLLPSLESGGAEAEAARRHAAECASCRAAAEMLDRVKAELATPVPLPAAMRRAFLDVAKKNHPTALAPRRESPGSGQRAWWWAALAACILAAATWAVREFRRGDDIVRPRGPQPPSEERLATGDGGVRRVGPITFVSVDPTEELSVLARNAESLTQRLSEATDIAERAAVQRAIERVLTDYRQAVAASE